MYQRMWTPHVERTRKQTRPIRFEHGNAIEIRNGIMFDFYPGLPQFIQHYASLISMIPEAEHPSEAC